VGERKAKSSDNILTHKKMRADRLHVLASKRGRKNEFLKQRKNDTYIHRYGNCVGNEMCILTYFKILV